MPRHVAELPGFPPSELRFSRPECAAKNAVYRESFPANSPARATVGVTRLASTYRIERDVTAAR